MIESMFGLLLELIGWIIKGICQLVIWILGKIFTNPYAFITAIVVAIIISTVYYCSSDNNETGDKLKDELYESTTTYVCTACHSLKVRVAPNVSAQQIGSLMVGEEVEVYDIIDGFAKIRFNGNEGYASITYLKQKYY